MFFVSGLDDLVARYCKTSNRRATKNSQIFEIAKQLVHKLISAANNSCNQTINVANISGRAISSALYIYCIDQLILAFVQCKKKKKLLTASSPLYKKLEVLKLQDLYYYNLAILAHDYFYSKNFPRSLTEKFDNIRSKSLHETRGRDRILNYQVPNLHNTYRKPTTACSMLWNSLPLEIKTQVARHLSN